MCTLTQRRLQTAQLSEAAQLYYSTFVTSSRKYLLVSKILVPRSCTHALGRAHRPEIRAGPLHYAMVLQRHLQQPGCILYRTLSENLYQYK